MKLYLENNKSGNLILFFCGWGMDETPFSVMKNESDICMFTITQPLIFRSLIFQTTKSVKLLSFSYGVYAGAIAKLPENLKLMSVLQSTAH